ncbi:phospholipase D, Pi-sPLD-like-2 [Phytophthora infestans T30-4]|uniref:phospholipase D n=1 Tax=Phytophthora infestans (strain T30-4) TaxID=403677 RepID=D0MR90_PHYIT|nr:phospholipase D, Pi-sPLD-like-2 [Phytophthora infestans T30-4]EEY58009.1 phospholipase D, Pi-sPLD-like-2 [Phytophthora infestans T30-4]|eukprot:XP_002909195.1 phospholipase D, Pi-sPLD-like-2 [Phytophthora infestans T30-4]
MLVLFFIYVIAASTTSSAFSVFGNDDTPATEADLSDGTDIKVRQPLLKATDWFLTEKEISDSRGGIPRSDLAAYTTGNAVTSFTVTKDFYDSVYEDLTKTKEGDRVLLSAYATALIPLKPDIDPTGATTGVGKVFTDVVKRGGNINILNWQNLKYRSFNLKARDAINAIPVSPINGAKAVLLFDDRLPTMVSSYHQKTMVILSDNASGSEEQPVAYVGGLDLATDRWDTIDHNNSAIRDASGITFKVQGWIDGHIRIHGPAAKDVANNFIPRWNSDYLPSQSIEDDVMDFENPSYEHIPQMKYASSNTTGNFGKQSVQITRTFSCTYKHYKEFAPRGENSLFHARIKAIKNAKNFIFIEDQYFIYVPELMDAIMEVMPKIQRLIVFANPQTSPFSNAGYIKYLYEMVSPIREKFPNKFKIYTTKADRNLMLHSKVVIIDDVYLSVGSANWNRRSMTSDPELNAEVVDEETVKSPEGVTVGKLPRDYRIRKFVEMTGLSYDELDAMTFIEAASQLALAAADESTILENLDIQEHAYFFAITDTVRKISDPQDTCTYSSR